MGTVLLVGARPLAESAQLFLPRGRPPVPHPKVSMRSLAVLVLLALAAPLPAQPDPPPPTDAPRVARVAFSGASEVDERLLRAAIETRRGTALDTAALRRDEEALRRVYAAWGYPDAAVRADVEALDARRVRVRFGVAEGAPVRVGSVQIRAPSGDAPIAAAELPIGPGDVYAVPRIEAAQRRLARAYAERGHAFVQVRVPVQPVADGHADLVLEVVPGPVARFGPTVLRSEPPLRTDAARGRLPFRAGERFHPGRLEHAAERLYALPIVDSVAIRPGPVEWAPDVVETEIAVGTGRAGSYEVRGIASSSTCIGFEGFVSHRHAFGAPRVLTVSAGTTNLFASEVCGADEEGAFQQPGYHLRTRLAQPVGRASWLLLEGAYLREAVAGAYVRTGWQARAGGARELARGLEAGLALAPERTDPVGAGALFCALYGACAAAPGPSLLVPVEASLAWERPAWRAALGPPPPGPAWMHPERPRWVPGAALSLAGGGGPTGSDHAFLRALGEASLTRVAGRLQLGGRLRAGALAGASGTLPAQLRLFGGGPRGVRGAPANQLGPRILVLREGEAAPVGDAPVDPATIRARAAGGDLLLEASVEGRVWATRWAQLAAFVDYGALRSRGGDAGPLAGTRAESLLSPGLGILAITPAGPIRLDVAYDPSPAREYPLLRAVEGGGYELLRFVRWDPYEGFRDRLRLQIGMGLPF